MQPETTKKHIGRRIEKLRLMKGIKQDDLATMIGVKQGTMSKIEKSETIEPERLKSIADALGLTVETIENFDESAVVNNFQNTFHDHSMQNVFNPIEKIVELYERMLETERKRNEELQERLKKYEK